MKIKIDRNELQTQIEKTLIKRLKPIFQGPDIKRLLEQEAVSLKDQFANSEEFQALKGRLIGPFGFTNQEVAGLDRILSLMVPDNDITYRAVETVNGVWWAMLQWVDYSRLKDHSFAQHELTRLVDGSWEVTTVVSWVEWLEEGVSIPGQAYMRTNRFNRENSRSGEGLMRDQPGFTFVIPPSRIFERLGKIAGKQIERDLRRGLGILIKKA